MENPAKMVGGRILSAFTGVKIAAVATIASKDACPTKAMARCRRDDFSQDSARADLSFLEINAPSRVFLLPSRKMQLKQQSV